VATIEELSRLHEQDLADERAKMADVVLAIGAGEAEAKSLTKPLEALRDQLKQWMALNEVKELDAPDGGYVAKLQDRGGTPVYDLISCVDADPQAVVDAARAGLLRVDHTALERLRKGNGAIFADTLARYAGPGQGSTALIVSKSDA